MLLAKGKNKLTSFRHSCSHMFFKIGIPRNFAIFTGNTCVGVSSSNFSEKRLQHKGFPENTAKNSIFLWNSSSGVSFSLLFNSCLLQDTAVQLKNDGNTTIKHSWSWYTYLLKMNRMFFANLKDFRFILFLFSLQIIYFKIV